MDTAFLEDDDPPRTALRLALADCLAVMHEDAQAGDGWSPEGYAALLRAAPLLGIAVTERRPDTGDDDGRVTLAPHPADVATALRSRRP